MSQTPRIPASTPAVVHLGRQPEPTNSSAGARPAFEALLERLTSRAAELEEKSKTLDAPDELPGAVDAARASLADAVELGEELLEAYRAARTIVTPEVES